LNKYNVTDLLTVSNVRGQFFILQRNLYGETEDRRSRIIHRYSQGGKCRQAWTQNKSDHLTI